MIDLHIQNAYYQNDKIVISQFDMHVKKGEIIAIIGHSGIGKSTVLKIIAGLHENYEGNVKITDNARIALIPQQNSLLPWKTVLQNIMLLNQSGHKHTDIEKASVLIQKIGLVGYENWFPQHLSGGQYQRVALGQAFFFEPDILLMDEPFSALDSQLKTEIQDLFMAIQKEKQITAVFVTHNMDEAKYLNAKIVSLEQI